MSFLPTNKKEMKERGWEYVDFVCVTGDAYVDHPSFGIAVISRYLEYLGYRVGIISQPNYNDDAAFSCFGKPRYAFMVTGGNIDSMVSNYTAAKKPRSEDIYAPRQKGTYTKRPDRAPIVYCKKIRQQFGDIAIVVGGLEASLRRFSHYDYWDDTVMHSLLFDSGANILTYGMGEHATKEIADRLKSGKKISAITDVKGTCVLTKNPPRDDETIYLPTHKEVKEDKSKYALATKIQFENQDYIYGKALVQQQDEEVFLLQNKLAAPLNTSEFDTVSELPYERQVHPMYDKFGGVGAIDEVEFSIIRNRGCFGACNFCSIAFHQGRQVTTRSNESVLREARLLTKRPNFKGYIHDVGGPTANFTGPSCDFQKEHGVCKNKKCLAPTPCKNLKVSHSEYNNLLTQMRKIEGIKKVFIRSGIRYDYLLLDNDNTFFENLVEHHTSGQLKVAPEHMCDTVLNCMGKPEFAIYERFSEKYKKINAKLNKKQFLVPYLMSSHPGSTLKEAISLAQYLKKINYMPEQVQDFYPTPGTISTAMFYTGLNPINMQPVYVPKSAEEKAMQRALLQYKKPQNKALVAKALIKAGRKDLIGTDKNALISPVGIATKPKDSSAVKLNLRGANKKKRKK